MGFASHILFMKVIQYLFIAFIAAVAGLMLFLGFFVFSDASIREFIFGNPEPPKRPSVDVTIPEGLTRAQIESRLREAGVQIGENEFVVAANTPTTRAFAEYGYDFLYDIDANSLEGMLFPDTYEFHLDDSVESIVDKFLRNFAEKVPDLSSYKVLILASLLEREVQTEEDMRLVAGVLNNRLAIGMPLQVDATLAYISNKKTAELTNADKLIDSPFNTYKYRGLPPAPIANPGLKAINAALNPKAHNYFYYLSAPDGTTHFAETLKQHNANKALYLF